jgi:hypothetical protein
MRCLAMFIVAVAFFLLSTPGSPLAFPHPGSDTQEISPKAAIKAGSELTLTRASSWYAGHRPF